MAEPLEISLHLCQVLEEEFESLHETLDRNRRDDDEVVVKDDDGSEVPVVVRRDWDFHGGHVRRALFADRLRNALKQWGQAHPDEKPDAETTDLDVYLASKYEELTTKTPDDAGYVGDAGYIEALRKVLGDDDVFVRERFERLATLRDETRGLAELWLGDAGARFDDSNGKASDRTRFRRLLLEDAFPESIRRVYDLRLNRVYQRIHELGRKRAAVCFSGGGIRSGTFALGVVQSLAQRGFLTKFDYLSTVSGGGYIGGWLTAWIHRHADGVRGVVSDLNGAARAPKMEPEPEPLRHLREYSNFITPRTGILSADAWTFVLIYLRNLLLNWVVLIPLLASVLMIPRVANAVLLAAPRWRVLVGLLVLGGTGALLLAPGLLKRWRKWLWPVAIVAVVSLLILGVGLGFWSFGTGLPAGLSGWGLTPQGALLLAGTLLGGYAVAYMRLNRPSNSGAVRPGSFFARHRDQNSFLWLCLLPLSASGVLLTTFWAWFRHLAGNADSPTAVFLNCQWALPLLGCRFSELTGFLIYGALLGLTGWFLYLFLAALGWLTFGGRREVGRMWKEGGKSDRQVGKMGWKLIGGKRWSLISGVAKNAGREFVITLLASLIGAALLYAVAVNVDVFYKPIRESFVTEVIPSLTGGIRPYTQRWQTELYTVLAFPAYLLVFLLGVTLFVGFTSRRTEKSPQEQPSKPRATVGAAGGAGAPGPGDSFFSHGKYYLEDEDREWLARASAWLAIAAVGWLFVGGLVIFGPLLFFRLEQWLVAVGGVSGLISVLGGRSALSPGQSKGEGRQGWLQTLGLNLIVVASFVFFACIIIAVSLLSGALIAWLAKYLPTFLFGYKIAGWPWESIRGMAELPAEALGQFRGYYPFDAERTFRVTHFPPWHYLLGLALALQILGRVASRLINLNKFSLHAGYRDRIIRAFLGASRLRGERRENPFTGFDSRDNLYMAELRPWVLRESDFEEPNGLAAFVGALAAPADKREPAAAYLRKKIDVVGSMSRDYFQDPSPSESVETNTSFRSALFGDLSRILQDYSLGEAREFDAYLAAARQEFEKLAPEHGGKDHRLLLNRLLLTRAFPDCLKYPPKLYRPMHVVNMALNLVGGDRLAWQQRRAESFTATPLHAGSLFVGYRPTRHYGGKNGISLGTAVAISGAAANSNMGYFSPSPFVTLILTFFNARLGWWLGNPGVHGADTYFRSHPQKSLSPILDEAFGLTDDENHYVLLSDGGHFENLGLYEMVLRRCRYIVVADGSADPGGSYDDLGGAVRKIRIDFGIRIEFAQPFRILSRPESLEKSGAYCAVGDIHYEDVDDPCRHHDCKDDSGETVNRLTGKLIYIKPAVYGAEPRDVFNYTKSYETFPHESTADQFFDEAQFESHRVLGFYILEKLFADAEARGKTASPRRAVNDLEQFAVRLEEMAKE